MISWLLGGAGIIGTLIMTFLAGRKAGDAQRQKDRADAYENHLRDIADAADADKRLPDIATDPNNRDTRG